ncbi:MAG TPA: alcohol dehydrogenase catalytic domain-containing protein, partial [Vicinamibacterales bacterium]|nr:alcohol dehydrogenase catalytic domain-containing protein [Vicinamibacterales bacterium]
MTNSRMSRRGLIKKAAAAAAAGGVLASEGGAALAQAPAVVTGRMFRAWISRGTGRARTTLQDVRLRPITGRQVVVRTEACNLCYSNVGAVLGLQAAPPAGGAANPAAAGLAGANANAMALMQGHGGVGVVEAVGPEVRRVQVGDRVCVSGTPQCGACYHCLRGRADVCQLLGRNLPADLVPVADLRDGTPVYANSHIGGLAELMVTFEEWVVPVVTKATAVDLGMVLSCVSVAGLGATTTGTLATVAPGSTVAVVGCGPLGLSAVQGARIAGASTIIAIDPIRVRRELALTVGATHVLDPNVEGAMLVERVRALSSGPTTRAWSGGRDSGGRRSGAGADVVVEAAGAEFVRPKLEAGPDPTGILPMQQAYEMCSAGGHVVTTGLVRGTIGLPAFLFAIGGITHSGGQAGGANPMR